MSVRSDLPPKLRNWKEGVPQVGVFLRTRKGSTITLVNDSANEDQETLVYAILVGTKNLPADIMGAMRTWVDSQIRQR
jgi:hypothetical protein